MTLMHLRLAPLQNPERYEALAVALAELAADLLGQDPATLAVTVDDLPAARCWIGGQVPQRPMAQLEVTLGAGAVSAAHKARFVAAAHTELARQLAAGGSLQEPSYVAVRELEPQAWGWGGTVQAQRADHAPAQRLQFRTAGRR